MSNVIVLLSGGKDSTACLLLAIEQGHDVIALFNETGWEHPDTYKYLKYLEKVTGVKIHETENEATPDMVSLIKRNQRYPSMMSRFCTDRFKVSPSRKFYNKLLKTTDKDYIAWYGMRKDESSARSKKYAEHIDSEIYDLDDIFPKVYGKKLRSRIKGQLPIVNWSEEQVFAYIQSRGIEPNPLYAKGEKRVGCYPCFLSAKAEIHRAFSSELGQQRLGQLEQLDLEIGTDIRKWIRGVPENYQGGCAICSA